MTGKLKAYREKRDFSQTAEPAGAQGSGRGQNLYVMHKHAASHDHFDLRLEQEGVLRSWALPKGPSLEPGEKRLAIEVEDHPLEYGEFEGIIPQGQYGGGTVMLWDQGLWRASAKPRADKLDFELQGEKLAGHWTLVKMHDQAARRKTHNNWLLIKRTDTAPANTNPDDRSVVSGRSMEEIAREEKPRKRKLAETAARAGTKTRNKPMPGSLSPQLATLVDSAPAGDDWLHEVKLDGYRLLAKLTNGKVQLLTRNGKDWTHRFAELAEVLAGVPVDNALLDGEIVYFESDGSTSFRKLQDSLGSAGRPGISQRLVYQVFDLLYLQGHDLRPAPLLQRKQALAKLLDAVDGNGLVRYCDHLRGQGPGFFEQACDLGLEGIVSKKADSPYRPGRQRSWLKTKCIRQDEFVVGGFSTPAGSCSGFGALLLGAFRDGRTDRKSVV